MIKLQHFLHGGDYNPEQWDPDVWDEDMRLFKLAHCNAVSVGIFSWARLEPEEGRFDFGWLDDVMERLGRHGMYIALATPSAAQPAWMSRQYPEVLRTDDEGFRKEHGNRVNYCLTSPIYREKVAGINRRLAERYKEHQALALWHVSNEYGGFCTCELCRAAFRGFLREKYKDLRTLNAAWWTSFWGRTYTAWEEIAPPGPRRERNIHGLFLDWKRFVTEQTLDFYLNETAPLRAITPHVPVTTNLMGVTQGLNYWKFASHMDVVAWDSYPRWHGEVADWITASQTAFGADLMRSLGKGQPFLLLESTPSSQMNMKAMKLKRPGMHRLASLQAVAHGSDSVMYFQWRQSRGGGEKFHGAVVAHDGGETTRVFREVAEVGEILERLQPIVGTSISPEVAVVFDWENRWAIEDSRGPLKDEKGYIAACHSHYRAFWRLGVPVDVVDQTCDFTRYKLLVAPMLYMLRPGVAERLEAFVQGGGVFVTTYWSGIADENDLCFLGGRPGPLRRLLGIWSEEIDGLYPGDRNHVVMNEGNPLGVGGSYKVAELADLIHLEGAEALARYGADFYAGRPALTVNTFGAGNAYYIAARTEQHFLDELYGGLIRAHGLGRALDADLPECVTAQMRTDGRRTFIFLLNFSSDEKTVDVGGDGLWDVLADRPLPRDVTLPGYGSMVLEREA